MKKKCCKCGQEKDVRSFYKSGWHKDGRACHCIKCEKLRYKKRKAENPEAINHQRKIWARKQKEKDPEFFRKKYQEQKERIKANHKSRKAKDWLKRRARAYISRELNKNRLTRPEICSECNQKGKIECHHEDYKNPKIIRWLCNACHVIADKERRKKEKGCQFNITQDIAKFRFKRI